MPTYSKFVPVVEYFKYDGSNPEEVLDLYLRDVIGMRTNTVQVPYIESNVDGVLTIRYDETSDSNWAVDSIVQPNIWIQRGAAPGPGAPDIGVPDATFVTLYVPVADMLNP